VAVGKEAVEWWRQKGTDTAVSFKVNPPEPRVRLVTAKRESGEFVVDCISTDGGGIPRNVTVEMGLALVKLQALSIEEFVIKTSKNPARILGLKDKGHLGPGADADITVLDLEKQKPFMGLSNGDVIRYRGHVCGKGCHIITTPAGEAHVREKGLRPIVVDPAVTSLCRRV
jgi:predicted amidohydrolase